MGLRLTKKDTLINLVVIISIVFAIGKLFYGSVVAGVILQPLSVPIYLQRRKVILEKKTEMLEQQFKDMLVSVSDALNTGYSMENAIQESYRDMGGIYGHDSYICKEIRLVISRIKLNISVEKAIEDFADRIGIENAKMFSRIYSVAKKTGGNMADIIKDVTDDIVLKQTVKEEISVAISEKKMEQRIMTVIPLFLIVYVNLSSEGFLDIMYDTLMGKVVMTICLGAYAAAYFWSEKIMTIEI